MKRILIVEDEPHLANGLKFNLQEEGYAVDTYPSAEDALPVFPQYDMMILDIMLPKMNGIELLTRIRKIDYKYPVLILSAKTSERDLVTGLSAGADDYMTKPFSISELILRVKRIFERQAWYYEATRRERRYHFHKYWIDFDTFEASSNKGTIKLTQYECYVMKYLIENKRRSISRLELLERVWGYNRNVETRTVDIFIARLRKLFEQDNKNPQHIKSIRGVGYQFCD